MFTHSAACNWVTVNQIGEEEWGPGEKCWYEKHFVCISVYIIRHAEKTKLWGLIWGFSTAAAGEYLISWFSRSYLWVDRRVFEMEKLSNSRPGSMEMSAGNAGVMSRCRVRDSASINKRKTKQVSLTESQTPRWVRVAAMKLQLERQPTRIRGLRCWK